MNVLDAKIKEGHLVKETTGTATDTAAAVATFDPECTAFILKNLSATVKLLYSIDDGSNFLTLEPLSEIEKNRFVRELSVKTASGTAAYNVEYTEVQ